MEIKTITGFFEEHARLFPDHLAAVSKQETLSYRELNSKANRLAHYLVQQGVGPEIIVALCLPRSLDLLITLIAVLKAGGAYLPLDPSQPEERLLFLLKDSNVSIVISESDVHAKLAPYSGTILLLDKDKATFNGLSEENLSDQPNPDRLAYVIYTSGSTGTPKGVLIEQRSVIHYSLWFSQYTQSQSQQRIDFSSNPIFDMAVSTTIVPLMLGLTVVLCQEDVKKDIKKYLLYLAANRVNLIKITPSYFKVLVQEVQNQFIELPHLQTIILGGENLTAAECNAWLTLYPHHVLLNEYGPTETTVAVSSFKVDKENSATLNMNVPIGKTAQGICALIMDPLSKMLLPDGSVGELIIGGTCLARGYLNQPELTAKQFITVPFNEKNTRFYRTGDLCKKRPDGVVDYLGRIDDQIKIRGFRIEPGEIEQCLIKHISIKAAVVVAQKDTFNEQRLVLYYITKRKKKVLKFKDLRNYLQKRLPEYLIPTAFVKLQSFPVTANGKLDKHALPVPLLSSNEHYLEPETSIEKHLAKIWSDELGVQLIGIHDDFFELGGHSLSAARIILKINNELGKNISLQELYTHTNIKKLSTVVQEAKKARKRRAFGAKKFQNKTKDIPLSDFQFLLWVADIFEPKAKKLNIVARKRLQGRLDQTALEYAFEMVLKKHEVLVYQVFNSAPMQRIDAKTSFKLLVHHLESLDLEHQESELQESMTHLINFYPWPNNVPLIIAKLFYLDNQESELQICIPHLISDDNCTDILFTELSKFYSHFTQPQFLTEVKPDQQFKNYVLSERFNMEGRLDKDYDFWIDYLKDASLFNFPEQFVVTKMNEKKIPYSTYTMIPMDALISLKHYCEQHHLSITHALCAAMSLAVRNCSESEQSKTPYTFMNIIQSTRDNPAYDNTVGCFLRIEPTKIALDKQANLKSITQQIKQSSIATSNYKYSSNLIKLCAISNFKPKKIADFFIKLFAPLYLRFFKIPPFYSSILHRCVSRAVTFKKNNKFIININIRNNFIADSKLTSNLFALGTKQINNHSDDLLAIDYVFEACFFREDNQEQYFLVISANLVPEFREQIAQEFLQILSSLAYDSRLMEVNLE